MSVANRIGKMLDKDTLSVIENDITLLKEELDYFKENDDEQMRKVQLDERTVLIEKFNEHLRDCDVVLSLFNDVGTDKLTYCLNNEEEGVVIFTFNIPSKANSKHFTAYRKVVLKNKKKYIVIEIHNYVSPNNIYVSPEFKVFSLKVERDDLMYDGLLAFFKLKKLEARDKKHKTLTKLLLDGKH